MRAKLLVAVVATEAALVGAALGAGPIRPTGSVTLEDSNGSAGAHPVALTFTMHYEMQCGRPGAGPFSVRVPEGFTLPASIPARDVLLDGKTPPSVIRSGRSLAVGIPTQTGVICDVIGPGVLTVQFKRAAGIGNAASPGSYSFRISVDGHVSATAALRLI